MASFEKSMELIKFLEFSNKDDKILHLNRYEDGLTFYGIYEKYSKEWSGWKIIKRYLKIESDIKKCSVILAGNKELITLTFGWIKEKFWDKAKLDDVVSQKIADEIFLFGFNAGMNVAIKKAQKVVNVKQDGIVGEQTLKAINSYNEDEFDFEFDEEEIKYYDEVIKAKPYLQINQNGWYKRALFAYTSQDNSYVMA